MSLSHPEVQLRLQNTVRRRLVRKSEEGDLKEVRRLLNDEHISFIFTEDDKNMALMAASENNYTKVIKLLLEAGANPDNRTFFNACNNGNVEVVKILLKDYHIDPSSNDNIALLAACRGGNLKIVDLLLNHVSVYPSAQNNGALIIASEYGHLKVVERLLSHPHFHLTSDSIKKALRFARRGGHLKIVELLDSVNTARAAFRPKNKKSVRKAKKSTRKSTRKAKKSARKSTRKSKKSTRKSSRKSIRKSVRKVYKSPRKSARKMKKSYCVKTPCGKMGFTQKASCRPYKNCYRAK
jgi:hypothetical protein